MLKLSKQEKRMVKTKTTIIILKENIITKCSRVNSIEIIGKLNKKQKEKLVEVLFKNDKNS